MTAAKSRWWIPRTRHRRSHGSRHRLQSCCAREDPVGYTAASCMSQPVVTVNQSTPLHEVIATMEEHLIRRMLVVRDDGSVREPLLRWIWRE